MSNKEIDLNLAAKPTAPISLTQVTTQNTPGQQIDDVLALICNKPTTDFMPPEDYTLPSLGYFYDGKIPEGKIQIRPMDLACEKIMSTARLLQSGQALDEVYKRCVKFPTPDFDPLDLLVGDRSFILYVLRGISYGNQYEFAIDCPACQKKFTSQYDLNLIAQTVKNPTSPKEPVRIALPHTSKVMQREVWVEMRYSRGRDIAAMMQRSKFIKGAMAKSTAQSTSEKIQEKLQKSDNAENVIIDQTIEQNLFLLIENVNGNNDKGMIKQFISRLHSTDYRLLRKWISQDAPGIDTEILVSCPSCEHQMRMDLPVTDKFFRP
jgi:hypothetical protein